MRFDRRAAAFGVGASLLVLVAGCRTERSAGTSTSVGDDPEGTALLSDGQPASGALVCARTGEVEYLDGIPRCKPLDSARADAQGRFRLDPERLAGSFYLEIACDAAAECSRPGEVFFRPMAAARDLIDEFALSPPGSLAAKITWSGIPDTTLWVGIRGTAHFAAPRLVTRLDGGIAWEARIDGLFPGGFELIHFGNDPSGARTRPLWIQAGRTTSIVIQAD
jgi:hypothetical protein